MLKSYDYSLIIVMVLLSLFGLVMVYSASMVWAVQRYGLPSDFFYQRQKMFLIGAFIVFLCAALFPYKMMKSNKILGFIVVMSLFGLMSLFVFGHIAGNAQSWFKIGGLSLQPSEFTKIAVIIYLSAVYAKNNHILMNLTKGLYPH